MSLDELHEQWPILTFFDFAITSEPTIEYNCVAFVVGNENEWVQFYDPDDNDNDLSSNKYVEYFKGFGFVECISPEFEDGMEKIALYENRRGEFTHVAIQSSNGFWKSKMGKIEDIEHIDLDVLQGNGTIRYGNHVVYMARPK